MTDDIIFSGVGSGCAYDDEDDCSTAGSGDKDSLVRPIVKIKTTPRPPTTARFDIVSFYHDGVAYRKDLKELFPE